MKYDIITTDNPWKYDNEKSNDPKMGGMTYKTLEMEELYSLNISEIAEKDSLLFSWSTMPKLKEGIEFIEKNGFKYITCPFVWVKVNPNAQIIYGTERVKYIGDKRVVKKLNNVEIRGGIYSGLGHYTAQNVELLLLGKRGKGLKRARKDIKQVQLAPRTRHSQKPEIFQDLIEELYPDVKYCELFARRKRDNWDCYGFEITGNDIKEDLRYIKNMEK